MRHTVYQSVALATAFCMGVAGVAAAAEPMSPGERAEKQLGSEGSAMGVPEPGTVEDIEPTKKKRNPSAVHTPDSNLQVTIGGAEYFIEGEVLKIEQEYFTIKKDASGEPVKLLVNRDTNFDCGAAPARDRTQREQQGEMMTTQRIPPDKQADVPNGRQLEQGQRQDETALGSGFRVGQCNFQTGDRVKAEVDDMGRVTTLKYLAGLSPTGPRSIGESAGTGELAKPTPQDRPGQLDMTGAEGYPPEQYSVLPVPLGEMKLTSGENLLTFRSVEDHKGNIIGTLENLIMDTTTGRVEYAVVLLEGGTHLHPVPWDAIRLKQSQDKKAEGNFVPVIDTSKFQLYPDLTHRLGKDLSPAISQLVTQLEVLRDREPRKAPKRDVGIKTPAAGGGQGEEEAAGGLSGPRALPPGKAPGFEEEMKKAD